jgi:hypothetical protein
MDTIYKLLLFLWFFGYSSDIEDITVSGRITDLKTGTPVANANIIVVSIGTRGPDYLQSFEKDKITGSNGEYSVHFDVGHEVILAADIPGYYPVRKAMRLNDNHTPVLNLEIEKLEPADTLIWSKLYSRSMEDPRVGYRFYYDTAVKPITYDSIVVKAFDLIKSKSTTDTTDADIWCRIPDTLDQPHVLVAAPEGGIIPVFDDEIRGSFMYEKRQAPKYGYVKEYTAKGNEIGYFIRCRDGKTYAKILERYVDFDTIGNGSIEYDIYFEYLYQPNGTRNFRYNSRPERHNLINGSWAGDIWFK